MTLDPVGRAPPNAAAAIAPRRALRLFGQQHPAIVSITIADCRGNTTLARFLRLYLPRTERDIAYRRIADASSLGRRERGRLWRGLTVAHGGVGPVGGP